MEPDYYGCVNCEGTGWLDEHTWCPCPLGQDVKAETMTDDTLYTTKQIANMLGITTGRVRQLARALDLGRWVGSVRLFSEADLDVMRSRNTRVGPVRRSSHED